MNLSTLVFTYGSNLDEAQMRSRCPGVRFVSRAELAGYALAFAGYSARWDGAVASLTPAPDSHVVGVVYRLSPYDLVRLDTFEGCPTSYVRVPALVTSRRGTRLSVETYRQPPPHLEVGPPSNRYFNTIWRAYERLGFDPRPLFRAVRTSTP